MTARSPGRRWRGLRWWAIAFLVAGVWMWGWTRQLARDKQLILAVHSGKLAAVDARLAEGASPNAVEFTKLPGNGFLVRVRNFLRLGAPRRNALELAINERRWTVAERLIAKGGTVPSAGLKNALERAASDGADEIVRHLLGQANVKAGDGILESALRSGIREAYPKVVERLLDHGADPSVATRAHPKSVPPILQMIKSMSPRNEPERRVEVLKILRRHGLSVNVQVQGTTMLHTAFKYGDLPVAEFLLEEGADLDAVDENGATARSRLEWFFERWPGAISPKWLDRLEGRTVAR